VDRGPGVSVWLSIQREWEAYPRRRAFNLVPCQDDDGYHLTEQLVFKHDREQQRNMKTTPKQTVQEANLGRLPKFAIPPELLILREIESLETSERLGPDPRLHYIIRQRQRD
jgi:hypothetical protein